MLIGSESSDRRGLVSIHASAWEATCRASATSKTVFQSTNVQRFNPRLRMGGDSRSLLPSGHDESRCFNPRLRMGGDKRHGIELQPGDNYRFNPRLRMGGDRVYNPVA